MSSYSKSQVAMTDRWVQTAKAINGKVTEFSDSKEPGLVLRVTPNGARSWTFRYRFPSGRQRRITFGRYNEMSLSTARAKVLDLRRMLRGGKDPAAEKQMERRHQAKRFSRGTVAEIGQEYLEKCKTGKHKRTRYPKPKAERSIADEKSYFDNVLIPEIGDLYLHDLSRSLLQDLFDDLGAETPSKARHSKNVLSGIFNYGILLEIVDVNPCLHVLVESSKRRKKVMDDAEIKSVWNTFSKPAALKRIGVTLGTAIAIKLVLLTAQRPQEVARMTVEDIDFEGGHWIIPDHDTKNRTEHLVPLSKPALELVKQAIALREVDSPFVFPSPRNAMKRSIQSGALTHAFIAGRHDAGWDDLRLYDLRRTAATYMAKPPLRVHSFFISKILNHRQNLGGASPVTEVYNRYGYLEEKQIVLNAWAKRLMALVNEDEQVSIDTVGLAHLRSIRQLPINFVVSSGGELRH